MRHSLQKHKEGFPCGSVVKSLPASAGDMDTIPDPGRSHMPRATKPMCHNYWAHMLQLLNPVSLEPVLHNKGSHCNENPGTTTRVTSPLAATRGKITQLQRPSTATDKYIINKQQLKNKNTTKSSHSPNFLKIDTHTLEEPLLREKKSVKRTK